MELLTLSKFINALNISDKNLLPLRKSETVGPNYANDLMKSLKDINEYNTILKKPLTLGMFIPCKNGKPLECPESMQEKILGEAEPSTEKLAKEAVDVYFCDHQEAEKRVLFEGFELDIGDNPEYYYLRSSDYLLNGFHCDSDKADINIASIIDARNIHVCGEGLNTISDLAEATQDNPIKLNESNNAN